MKISGPPTTLSGAGSHLELVPLATLKAYLDRTSYGTADDTLLQSLLDNVQRMVYEMLGRRVLKATAVTIVHAVSGNGTRYLVLPHWPILTVTSVDLGYISEAPNTWTTSITVPTTEYYVDAEDGMLVNIVGGWSTGLHNYRVTWTAGYSTIPHAIQDAVCEWVGVKLQRIKEKRFDKLTISKETESASFTADEIPQRAWDGLRVYRRVEVGVG